MAKRASVPKDRVPITLRLDGDIHEALKLISTIEMRSLNTQIEYFLRKCVLEYEAEVEYFDDRLEKITQRIKSGMSESPTSESE